LGGEPELNEDLPERDLLGSPKLLAECNLQPRRRDHSGVHPAGPDPRLVTGVLTQYTEETDQIGRAERLDDESRGSDRARERAVLRIVVRREEDYPDRSRVARRGELPTDGEAVAVVAFEVHVEQQYLGSPLSRQSEALFGARGLDYVPTLGRQRQSRGRAESRVIVGNENGQRVRTSSSAARGEIYVVGLVRTMTGPLLALPNPGSSESLVQNPSERIECGSKTRLIRAHGYGDEGDGRGGRIVA
jgi:hypothetical protein